MYCYRCGNKLPEESLFCNRCGTRVRTTPERMRNSNAFESGTGGQPTSSRTLSDARDYLPDYEDAYADSSPVEDEDDDEFDERPRPRPSGRPATRTPRTAGLTELSAGRSLPFNKSKHSPEADDESEYNSYGEFEDDLDETEEEAPEAEWEEDLHDQSDSEIEEANDEENEWMEDDDRPVRRRNRHPHPFRGAGETVIFSINPAFYPVATGYIVSAFTSLAIAAILSFFHVSLWVVFGAAIITFVPSIIRHIRHLHTVFTLTTIKLEISEGLFSKTTRNIPLRHIQDVSVRENFKERMMGIGDIIVDNAAIDSSLILHNVNDPRQYSDLILEQLERWN